ncbi:MAG: CoA pyrophosphatase, partial [Flavobacteriales bacterium]
MNRNIRLHHIKNALSFLRGDEAHLAMSSYKEKEKSRENVKKDAKTSAVLLLLFPTENHSLETVFIQRPEYDGVHSGQISFPGGGREIHDKNLKETSLRETREEIGVLDNEVSIIGNLSDLYIPPSNYLVTPFVGYTDKAPNFNPDSNEVN